MSIIFISFTAFPHAMVAHELSPEQIEALEFQTEQAYAALIKAVNAQTILNARWAKRTLTILGEELEEILRYSAFLHLGAEERTPARDKYLLPYLFGCELAHRLNILAQDTRTGYCEPTKETSITEDVLKNAIDEANNGHKTVSYGRLNLMAEALINANNCDVILKVISYVKNGVI